MLRGAWSPARKTDPEPECSKRRPPRGRASQGLGGHVPKPDLCPATAWLDGARLNPDVVSNLFSRYREELCGIQGSCISNVVVMLCHAVVVCSAELAKTETHIDIESGPETPIPKDPAIHGSSGWDHEISRGRSIWSSIRRKIVNATMFHDLTLNYPLDIEFDSITYSVPNGKGRDFRSRGYSKEMGFL
ncbi:unnamed protein product [Cyprideis torosa]|uniref:Uncharacterized protein n=1 Tax=Cyprideis torosa TaxID=163714 RepID=A0A7R8WQT1_9CRUS|nr:unnamed protein product [Cyprideis torosa]CAG0903376.1 unnamed protein product [Cyprideis torosa]